jgi:GNAT superfamily N-acetyltransferase
VGVERAGNACGNKSPSSFTREECLQQRAFEAGDAFYLPLVHIPLPRLSLDFMIERYLGPRGELRELFELAEDSPRQLDAYLDLGDVLVAALAERPVGHIQLIPTGRPGELELKNRAVQPSVQGRGIGRALIEAAFAFARQRDCDSVLVATAAADTGNLRFYQRLGFRMSSVERDAFTPARGYPGSIEVDGIELRDRVWLTIELQ